MTRGEITKVNRVEVIEDRVLYEQMLEAHAHAEEMRAVLNNERRELNSMRKSKGRTRRIEEIDLSLKAIAHIPSVVKASVLLEEMVNGLDKAINSATETIHNFANELLTDENPVYAIGWCTAGAIKAAIARKSAARIKENLQVMHADDWAMIFEHHIADAAERVMRQARNPGSRSTSVMSNFVDDIENSVYAKMLESWGFTPLHSALADYEFYSTRQVGAIYEDRGDARKVDDDK